MPCEHRDAMIICGRRSQPRCETPGCSRPSQFLCDYPVKRAAVQWRDLSSCHALIDGSTIKDFIRWSESGACYLNSKGEDLGTDLDAAKATLAAKYGGTCDRQCCALHRVHVGSGKDYCIPHHNLIEKGETK